MSDAAGWRCLALGGEHAAVEWADERAARWVQIALGTHPQAGPCLPGQTLRVHSSEPPGALATVFQDTRCVYRGNDPAVAMLALIDGLIGYWVGRCQSSLLLHAALVSFDGNSVLLPGASGAGKTTLAARLLDRGWRYHSDEVVALDERLALEGLGRALCLKPGSRSLFSAAPLLETAGVALMPPPASSALAERVPGRLAAIVFPRFSAGGGDSLSALSGGRTVLGLVESALNGGRFADRGLSRLGALVRGTPCFSYHYGEHADLGLLEAQLLTPVGVPL